MCFFPFQIYCCFSKWTENNYFWNISKKIFTKGRSESNQSTPAKAAVSQKAELKTLVCFFSSDCQKTLHWCQCPCGTKASVFPWNWCDFQALSHFPGTTAFIPLLGQFPVEQEFTLVKQMRAQGSNNSCPEDVLGPLVGVRKNPVHLQAPHRRIKFCSLQKHNFISAL